MKGICFEIFSSGAAFCLFGSTGNLARKKIIPALCEIYLKEYVRENFFVLNVGSKDFDDESFRIYISKILEENGIDNYYSFLERNYYFKIDYSSLDSYKLLKSKFKSLCETYSVNSKVFYLSILPSEIITTIDNLAKSNILDSKSRVVIEKPYGVDFNNASMVAEYLVSNNLEDIVYRIDHYAGKDGIINLLLARFVNYAFEKTLNRDFIDNIQVTLYESEGVEGRIKYFEPIGIFKDMFSHLIQIISFAGMELPNRLLADDIRDRKIKFVKDIMIPDIDEIKKNFIRAQYESYMAYKKSLGLDHHLCSETFVSFKMYIGNDRWMGVPIYVKIGKKMREKITRVDFVYKKIETDFTQKYSIDSSNILTFIIQPEIKIEFSFLAKTAGPKFCLSNYTLSSSLSQKSYLAPSDYERLLIDCMNGDKTLFLTYEEVKKIWDFIKVYDDVVRDGALPCFSYPDGGWISEFNRPVNLDGREWIYI